MQTREEVLIETLRFGERVQSERADHLQAENDRLRTVLQEYFNYDWSEKLGLWEERAKAVLASRTEDEAS